MKIRPTQEIIIQKIHPLVAIKTRSERKETIKEKIKNFTPKEMSKNFTPIFFAQSKRRERQCMGFKFQITEKLNNNNEEGYEIQTVRCLFFKKKTNIQARKKKD